MKAILCNSKNWFTITNKNRRKLKIVTIKNKNELSQNFLEEYKPDYIFFAHWNWIVPKEILESYECIVFHTAPLPYGRGGSPIQNLILNGYKSSPVCALKMTEGIDAGPIYSNLEISLSGSLTEILSRLCIAINKLISNITDDNITPVEQKGEPYLFKRLSNDNNRLPLDIDLEQVYDRVRMLDHVDYPNAFIQHGNLKIEFFNAENHQNSVHLTCKISRYK